MTTQRLGVRVSRATVESIGTISQRRDTDITGVVHHAIRLMCFLDAEFERGRHLEIVDADGTAHEVAFVG